MKRLLIVGGIAVAILVLLLWGFSKRSGPRYKGKTVEEWFVQYYSTGNYGEHRPIDHYEAKIALAVLVTNSVPFLIEEAKHPRRDTLVSWFGHLAKNLFTKNKTRRYIAGTNIAAEAEFAIKDIRPPAAVLMPELTNWLSGPKNSNYTAAVFWLGCIGDGAEQSVPYLAEALTNSPLPLTKVLAAQSLDWLGSKSKAALPALIASLNDTNPPFYVYNVLGNLAPDSREALPLLDKKLKAAANNQNRMPIAAAICSIDPTRTDAAEIFRDSLNASDSPDERRSALYLVRNVGAAAKTVVPQLLELTRGKDDSIATTAIDTLQEISPEDAKLALREKMGSEKPNLAMWAAGWLLRLEPNNADAITLLTNHFSAPNRDATWDSYALEQVGDASPTETNVIGFLREFSNSSNKQLREQAEQSLKKIRLTEESEKLNIKWRN